MLINESINRRNLLKGTLGAGLLAALPLHRLQASPQSGGTFRLGVADFATQDTLDPAAILTRFQIYLNYQLRNCLVEVGPGGKLIPELAESWEGSPDAKTWTFKLRSGVTFHNGKPLTPQDVIYSYRLHLAEGTKSPAKPFLASLVDIRADGGDKVVFELSAANVGFPAITSSFALLIVQDGDPDLNAGVGTGGYILEEFTPGIRSVVKRNPNYWKADRAHFDSVVMLCIKDPTARTNALLSGEIDAYHFVNPKTATLLERNATIRLQRVSSKGHYIFPMMVDAPPFDQAAVREAMKYAIDREDMIKRILNGFGTPGNDQPLTPAYAFHDPSIAPRAYDPDKAKFLLKQAGQSNLKVQLKVSDTPFVGATDAAVLFKEHAAKCGIDIEVVKVPEDGYWSDVWIKTPFCASRSSGRANEDATLSLLYTDDGTKAGWNETHLHSERLNALVVEARAEFDEAKRREMYAECQRIIRDEGGSIIWTFVDHIDAVSTKVANSGELSSDWDLDGGRAAERWWFS